MPDRRYRDERGAAVVDFVLVLLVVVPLFLGIFQVGLLFQANAGMQHALGEAARYATIFPTPSDAAITNMVTSKKFGTYNGTLGTLSITNNNVTTGVAPNQVTKTVSKDLTLQYTHTMRFLFIPAKTITLTKTKRVYLAA